MQDVEKISKVFEINTTTIQIKLDILDVYLGYRKGARIICKLDSEVESIVKILLDINIKVSVGKGLVFQKKGLNNVVDFFENDNFDYSLRFVRFNPHFIFNFRKRTRDMR